MKVTKVFEVIVGLFGFIALGALWILAGGITWTIYAGFLSWLGFEGGINPPYE